MKQWRWLVQVLLGGALVLTGLAADKLDSLNGHGWSPNNRWFAFNPNSQNELLIASVTGHRIFLLKPVGEVVLDTSNVFASENRSNSTAGVNSVGDGITMTIGSPGRDKLVAQEWSPDGGALAYSYERKMRAIFSIYEQTVTGTCSISNRLPWLKDDDLRVVFEYQRGSSNRPAQYALRVVRPDNSLVKEHLFQDPKEIARISLLRNTDSSFITPDRRQIIYPKLAGTSWQLVTEDVAGNGAAHPLIDGAAAAPYEWKLSPDGKRLAVVEGATSLVVGPLDHWSQAEHVTFSNLTFTVAWSPDGRFLAANDRKQLYLLEFSKDTQRMLGDLALVSSSCNPQFWGWRGTRLLFGDIAQEPADLYCLDTAAGRQVEQLIHSKHWQSAPSVRTISPDGTMLICVVEEIDGEGQQVREIWKTRTTRDADWELLDRKAPGSGL